jgi:predicted DNA-binding transcriptional regulator AlpA
VTKRHSAARQETYLERKMTNQSVQGGASEAVLIDAAEVGKLLNCSPKTVTRMAKRGEFITPIKVGRLRKWNRRAIFRWIGEQQQKSGV